MIYTASLIDFAAMLTSDFDFDLPDELIAQFPLEGRSSSRLMHVDPTGEVVDRQFVNLPDLLTSNDLLVFNDTRVIPARLYGKKETGGKVELLIERLTSETDALAHIRSSKSPKPGARLIVSGQVSVLVTGRQGALFCVRLEQRGWMEVLAEFGHMPLPPYIQRDDSEFDEERYQTVYAKNPGAVAAPTAGLHFDQEIFDALDKKGVERDFVTLHVGAGTFQPVKVDDISEHVMHEEYLEVSEELVEKIASCKKKGGRVVAVGTTSVRSLETAARSGALESYRGMSDIFITPGSTFNVVDAMVTNFHLPQSTLLMLVSAFIGHGQAMSAYKHAVNEKYRFFSYGDAMFLEKASNAV